MSRQAAQAVSLTPDLTLLALGATLLAIGLVAITSASVGYAEAHHGNMWYLSQRHGVYLAIALTAGAICY